MLQWQKEYGGANELPSIMATLLLFAVLVLVLVATLGPGSTRPADDEKPAALCAEHAGRPGWPEVCK